MEKVVLVQLQPANFQIKTMEEKILQLINNKERRENVLKNVTFLFFFHIKVEVKGS